MPSSLHVIALSFAFYASSIQAADSGFTRAALVKAKAQAPSYNVRRFTLPLNAVTDTGHPTVLAPIDVDGDGDQDLIVVYEQGEVNSSIPMAVLRNDGTGAFTDVTSSVFPGGAPRNFVVNHYVIADFNGDRRDDLFLGDSGWDADNFPGQQNVLLLSSGATGFVDATATNLPQVADTPHSTTHGDVNGDGFLDIYVGNQNGGTPRGDPVNNPYLLLNNGLGSFTRSDLLPATALDRSRSCSLLFDADGDGDQDLLVGSVDGLIHFNPGNGDFRSAATASFAAPTMINAPLMLTAKALDLNGDGSLDLVITYDDSPLASFATQALINDGSGHFTDQTSTRIPADLTGPMTSQNRYTSNFALRDLNGDGFTDILLQNGTWGANQRPVLINDGTGAFVRQPASLLGNISIYPNHILGRYFPMDANSDGRLDIVMYDQRRNVPEYQSFFALLTSTLPAPANLGPGYTGAWYNPAQDGHGIFIEILPNNIMVAAWYVFSPGGQQSWIVGSGNISGNTAAVDGTLASGGRFLPNFNPAQIVRTPWGRMTFTFTDCNNGRLDYTSTVAGYGSGSIPLARLTLPAGSACTPAAQ